MRKTVQVIVLALALSASTYAGEMQCPPPAPPPPSETTNAMQEADGSDMQFPTTSEETATQTAIILLNTVLTLL